jgi:hypothetical protein
MLVRQSYQPVSVSIADIEGEMKPYRSQPRQQSQRNSLRDQTVALPIYRDGLIVPVLGMLSAG